MVGHRHLILPTRNTKTDYKAVSVLQRVARHSRFDVHDSLLSSWHLLSADGADEINGVSYAATIVLLWRRESDPRENTSSLAAQVQFICTADAQQADIFAWYPAASELPFL